MLKEQCGASASLIIDILKDYSTDIQIVNIVITILYNLLLKEGSLVRRKPSFLDTENAVQSLNYPEAIQILFSCAQLSLNASLLLQIASILNRLLLNSDYSLSLLTLDSDLLITFDATSVLQIMSHFLVYCNSPVATRSIFSLFQTLLSNGRKGGSVRRSFGVCGV